MNYHNIKHDDMTNGDGLRVTLFMSGCEHHCPECQNPQTWDYDSGIYFDDLAMAEIDKELSKEYISGITFSGGDPLAPNNIGAVLYIIKQIKFRHPDKTIWLYTGYTYESILSEGDYESVQVLKNCDVIIDGEYKKDLRDLDAKWRGSRNQRVIDVKKSLETSKVVLWCD